MIGRMSVFGACWLQSHSADWKLRGVSVCRKQLRERKRGRVDGEKRELAEEEAVGERQARQISAAHALGMPREI